MVITSYLLAVSSCSMKKDLNKNLTKTTVRTTSTYATVSLLITSKLTSW